MELEKEYLAETAERINQYSRVNAFRWSEEALLNVLDTKIRTPIGWSKQLWPKSNLSRLRFYELDSELKKAGLNSSFWFVSNQINQEEWLVDNPFITKQIIVTFEKNHGKIKAYLYGIENHEKILKKTDSLLEAVLLSQP